MGNPCKVKIIWILLNILTTTLLKQKINCDQEILNRICASKRHNSFFNKHYFDVKEMKSNVLETAFETAESIASLGAIVSLT